MKAVHKKLLLAGTKATVLTGVLLYALGNLQLDDELLVPTSGSRAASRLVEGHRARDGRACFELPTPDGRIATVPEGTRLRLVPNDKTGGRTPPQPSPQSTSAQSTSAQSTFPQSTDVVAASAAHPDSRWNARTPDGTVVQLKTPDVLGPDAAFERLPGLRSTWGALRIGWFLAAAAVFGPAIFMMVPRWYILLRASGVAIPFWTAARLVYMSHFLNTFMPGGAVGGDAVRALVVTSHSQRKAEAATMVLIDRVVGLLGLLAMSGVVVLFNLKRLHGAVLPIGVVALGVITASSLFYSETARRLVRYDALLARLPRADVLKRVDAALYDLKGRPGALASAFAITLVLQSLEVLGIMCAGQALGIEKASLSHYLAFVPIGYLANAIPLSFGGIGLMEGAYLKLFADAAVATPAQAFMLGALARVAASIWGLPGALSALFPPTVAKSPSERRGAGGIS